MNRHLPITLSLLAALLLLPGFRKVAWKSGDEIMEEVASRHTADSELEMIKLVVVDEDGNTQVRELLSVYQGEAGGKRNYLIRFLSPADVKGITLLTNDESNDEPEQWFFMPALGQARKIAGDNRSGYFMGSDFTYEDLRKENTEEHDYHRLQDDSLDGRPVYVVMSAPAGVDVEHATGYANRLLYIDQQTFDILKVEFYEKNNPDPIKVLEADDYAEVDGPANRPARIRMNNKTNGTYSVMTLVKSRLNVPIEDTVFDPGMLPKWTPETDDVLLGHFEQPAP